MEQPLFHVLLDGRKVGPYDRRTIVGMRIKETLTGDHLLEDASGAQLTVGDLIGGSRGTDFNPARTGGYSLVQATYAGSLVEVHGKGVAIPRFKGEAEIRVQGEVLRIAGRFRHRFGWKEDRVKLVLKDIVHARVRGSRVDLGLRVANDRALQRLTLELFTAHAAGELVDWLPAATAWPAAGPGASSAPGGLPAPPQPAGHHMLWVSIGSVILVLGIVMAVLLARRLY